LDHPVSSRPAKTARSRFAEIVSREDEQINLAEAALLIAAEEYPRLVVEVSLEKLDLFGDIAREQAAEARDAIDIISALNSTLFERLGFRGNRESYYDPRNSFLNEVIDRRIGIPITLTVVYIEVARRIGFSLKGVGLPFHFIAKHEAESGDIFINPFSEGRVLGVAACAELVTNMSGGRVELKTEHLEPVSNKQILTRMLSNLLGVYSASDRRRALAAIERILLINPDSTPHIRDRGLLLAAVGDSANAIAELERYLALAPEAADADAVREQIKSTKQNLARLN
jgi:regulator of sirC expression with transglutaminase-like and TPR domain